MELLAIVLSVPAAFICSIVYSLIIGRLTRNMDQVRTMIVWSSAIVLSLSGLEALAVATIGAPTLRQSLGVPYYPLHLFLFFFSVPSLANVLALQRKAKHLSRWYAIGTMCAIVGLGVVLLQYTVSEALYGIDGMGRSYERSGT